MILRDTCRIHNSPTGQKRIQFDSKISKDINLPVKKKLLLVYDTDEKVLTISEL